MDVAPRHSAAMVAGIGLALAACSAEHRHRTYPHAGPDGDGGSGTPGSGSSGGQDADLNFQVNFNGTDSVQGSFSATDWGSSRAPISRRAHSSGTSASRPQDGRPTTWVGS